MDTNSVTIQDLMNVFCLLTRSAFDEVECFACNKFYAFDI